MRGYFRHTRMLNISSSSRHIQQYSTTPHRIVHNPSFNPRSRTCADNHFIPWGNLLGQGIGRPYSSKNFLLMTVPFDNVSCPEAHPPSITKYSYPEESNCSLSISASSRTCVSFCPGYESKVLNPRGGMVGFSRIECGRPIHINTTTTLAACVLQLQACNFIIIFESEFTMLWCFRKDCGCWKPHLSMNVLACQIVWACGRFASARVTATHPWLSSSRGPCSRIRILVLHAQTICAGLVYKLRQSIPEIPTIHFPYTIAYEHTYQQRKLGFKIDLKCSSSCLLCHEFAKVLSNINISFLARLGPTCCWAVAVCCTMFWKPQIVSEWIKILSN